MRNSVILLLVVIGIALLYVGVDMPVFGDPNAPASVHVSDHYIEHAYEDAETPNIVTVMIADYRGFDTFFETVVVFTAGLACFLLLRAGPPSSTEVEPERLVASARRSEEDPA